jgi:citrate synthase
LIHQSTLINLASGRKLERGGEPMHGATSMAAGLSGVVVADTELSLVDGASGRLVVRGVPVEALGARRFEEACLLLWSGRLPDAQAASELSAKLGAARVAAHALLPALGLSLGAADGMDALRGATAALSLSEATAPLERAITLTAALAVFAAAWARSSRGLAPLAPLPELAHAADYLHMVHGDAVPAARVRALDSYLCTVVDHGMNASTFAARVVASTESDDVSAVVAALGALKGRLHGGAPGPVLDMLDAVGEPEHAARFVAAELSAGRRIMGMGHRVYRVRDPRAAVLEAALERLEASGTARGRLSLARAVEHEAERALAVRYPERALCANVEFFTAVLLEAIGLSRTLFTPTFAVGRVAGWCAHIAEQRRSGKLIRPESRYVGPLPA